MYKEDENETEKIDTESTCHIRETVEDWKSVNFNNSLNFTTTHTKSINKNQEKELWLEIKCNSEEINWLVDTMGARADSYHDKQQKTSFEN